LSREPSASWSYYSYQNTRCHPKDSNFIFTFTHILRFRHLIYIWYRGGVLGIRTLPSKMNLSILVTNHRHLETQYLGPPFNLWLMFSGPVMIFGCVFNTYEINKRYYSRWYTICLCCGNVNKQVSVNDALLVLLTTESETVRLTYSVFFINCDTDHWPTHALLHCKYGILSHPHNDAYKVLIAVSDF